MEPARRLEVRATGLRGRTAGGRVPPGRSGGHRHQRTRSPVHRGPFRHPRGPRARLVRGAGGRDRGRGRAQPIRSPTASPSTAIPRTRLRRRSAAWWWPTTVAAARCTAASLWIPGLRFVVVVPDRPLPPTAARASFCRTGDPRADAVFNLGRMGLLLAGLADRPRARVPRPGRTACTRMPAPPLFPEAPDHPGRTAGRRRPDVVLVRAPVRASWPCARPTPLPAVRRGRRDASWTPSDVPGQVRVLEADLAGVTVWGPAAK